jgi:stringent starvation protein B
MGTEERLPAKKDVMLALLEKADVFIHLDPRRDNVRVPPWFKKQPHLVLQIGLNMPVAITDLEVSDDSVSCTLSFNRSPFFCWIPWAAVYALVGSDNRAMVWPEDIPPEVAAQAAKAAAIVEQNKQKRAHLRAVVEEAVPEATAPKTAEAPPAEAPKGPALPETPAKGKRQLPSYLRVVK